jgi:putative transposase
VDVGVRVLATVAGRHGQVIERAPNPRPLQAALTELRHLSRERSRRTRGSRRYTATQQKITRLQRRVAAIRGHHLHTLTTRLAKTHGEIVVEGLDAAGMLRQKGLPGARARRRGLSDSALGQIRRQLACKTGWYGSRLVHRGPLVPVLQDLPRLRAGAGHRVGRTLDLHPVRDPSPARRQRRHQPRALRAARHG